MAGLRSTRNKLRAIALAVGVLAVLFGVAVGPAASAVVVLNDGFDTLDGALWDTDFVFAGVPVSGSSGVSSGAFFMRPGVYRGQSALHAKVPAITDLPATVRFRARFPSYTYRIVNLLLLGSYDPTGSCNDQVVTWHLSSTHHTYFRPSWLAVSWPGNLAETTADQWPVLPTDAWLEGEMRLFDDRIATSFNGTQIEVLGDVQAALADRGALYPAFEVGDDYGQNGMQVDYIVIEQGADEPPNEPPVAVGGSDRLALVGSPVAFDGSDSYDPDGSIASYEWDFGDGAMGAGPATSHTYSAVGTYEVQLTVTDDDGAADVDDVSVRVVAPEVSIQQLIDDVNRSLPTPPYPRGVRQSLIAKLQGALSAYRAGDLARAARELDVFARHVRGGAGKRYTREMAGRWVPWAGDIAAALRAYAADARLARAQGGKPPRRR